MNAPRLSKRQREQLVELADIRDNGSTGEAYWRPGGAAFKTADSLLRLGYLRYADHRLSAFELTDEGYAVARAAVVREGTQQP